MVSRDFRREIENGHMKLHSAGGYNDAKFLNGYCFELIAI